MHGLSVSQTIIADDNIIAALEDAYGVFLDGASDCLINQCQATA